MAHNPRIVLLGGGTGSFALLQGIKTLTQNITAVVSMSDDGGSTGILRDELGVLPPGDVRQCLVALSDLPEVRDLFSYRFGEGRLRGQSLGNIILSGLELQYGNFEEAVRIAGELLRVKGEVIPVTLQKHRLIARDGRKVYQGEHALDTASHITSRVRLGLEPESRLNPAARRAILGADVVVIAPGSIYTSLIPILCVSDMSHVLSETNALIVGVANLVNKPSQTDGWHVVDYMEQLERYLGDATIDVVLYNNQPIAQDLLAKYAAEGEIPVDIAPARFGEIHARAIGVPLVSTEIAAHNPADIVLDRSFIRHDGLAVAEQLRRLLL